MTSRSDRRPDRGTSAKHRPGASRRSGFGGTLLGLFVGIALGLGLAAGVAYYLTRAGNPYQSSAPNRDPAREPAKESPRAGKADAGAAEKPRFDFYKILPGGEEPKVQAKPVERSSDRATAERAASPDKADARAGAKADAKAETKSPAKADGKADAKAVANADGRASSPGTDRQGKPSERFWLQAGSFANESDAENLKARLAFAGWEATIQAAAVQDKGVRYRVRVGPYDNTDQLQRMKSELAARGFDAAVIKF
jgi:cell division protein FtsN